MKGSVLLASYEGDHECWMVFYCGQHVQRRSRHWKKFTDAHDIQVGDTVVFEATSPHKLVAHIYREDLSC